MNEDGRMEPKDDMFAGQGENDSVQAAEWHLRDVLRSTLDMQAAHAFVAGCELSLEIAEDVPSLLEGPAGALALVVTRLLVEVLGRFGRVVVRVSVADRAGQRVRIAVEVEAETVRTGQVGMGKVPDSLERDVWANMRKLLDAVGGSLDARPGPGVSWRSAEIVVPFVAVVEHTLLQGLLDGDVVSEGLTVLLAHPDPQRRAELKLMLTDSGMQVTEVGHGMAALGLLQKTHERGGRFDVVLAAEALEGLDGQALADVIRSDPDMGSPALLLLFAGDAGARRTGGSRVSGVSESANAAALVTAIQYAVTKRGGTGTSKLRRRSMITRALGPGQAGEAAESTEPAGPSKQRGVQAVRRGSDRITPKPGQAPEDRQTQKLSPPADLGLLYDMTDSDQDLIVQLAMLFLEDTTERREALEKALDAEDAETARREAHTIKGGAANFGAERLRSLAAEMESLAKEGNLHEVRQRLATLDRAIEEVSRWLCETLDLSCS